MAYDFWGSNFGGKQDKNTGKVVSSTPSKPSTTKTALSTALSKSSGSSSKSSSKSSSPAYSEHVSWFGSPEKYASAIRTAESSGTLNDKAAAEAFKRDNPQYFGGIVPGGGGTPTPSYSSGATGGGATSTGATGNNSAALITALKNIGSQFGSTPASGQTALNTQANEARNAFIQAGGNFQDIPTNLWGSTPDKGFQTGAESFMGAPSYGSDLASGGMPPVNAGLTPGPAPKDTAEAIEMGMITPQNVDFFNSIPQDAQEYFRAVGGKNEDLSNIFAANFQDGKFNIEGVKQQVVKYVNENIPQQPIMEQPIDIMQQVQPLLQSVISQYEINAETAPIFQQKFDELMSQIDSVESNYLGQLEQMGKGIDPATQAALASLKDTVNEQRKYLQEEMSSRGLLQSGIYLRDLDERINKNELSETQKLLGQRLSDIQNQINNALLSFGNTRIQATSQYGLAAQEAADAAATRKQTATKNLTDALMKALELSNQQKSDAAKTAWEKEKFYAPWEKGPTPSEMLQYQYPSADAQMKQSQWETEWPYKQAQYQYDLNKPYYKPGSGSSGTSEYKQQQDAVKNTQWIENEASARAQKDPRLSSTGEYYEEKDKQGNVTKTYYTLPQLIDAHRRDLTMQLYGY